MDRPPQRWAVWCAHLAVLSSLPSGIWRILVVLHVPLGLGPLERLGVNTLGGSLSLVFLTTVQEFFAFLTLGLVSRWGEVMPRWIPLLGGRTVRPWVAALAAGLGAVALTVLWTGSIVFARPTAAWYALPELGRTIITILYAPLLVWGPLLGVVTVAYVRRHRG